MRQGNEHTSVWHPLRDIIKARRWDYQRFEDSLTLGIPDVNICVPNVGEWWLELKYLDRLPVRPDTPVKLGLRREQHLWLRSGYKAGRHVGLAARVGKLWCLWATPEGWEKVSSGAPWQALKATAVVFGHPARLLDYLASG